MEWRKCKGFEDYEVSNTGLVKSNKSKHKGELMAQMDDGNGYLRLKLSLNGKRIEQKVHRLVAIAFCYNP